MGPSLTCLPSAGGLINHSLSDVCYGLPAVIMGWNFEANDGLNPSYFSEIIPEHNLFPVCFLSQRSFSHAASSQIHISISAHLKPLRWTKRLKGVRSVSKSPSCRSLYVLLRQNRAGWDTIWLFQDSTFPPGVVFIPSCWFCFDITVTVSARRPAGRRRNQRWMQTTEQQVESWSESR